MRFIKMRQLIFDTLIGDVHYINPSTGKTICGKRVYRNGWKEVIFRRVNCQTCKERVKT